MYIKKHDVCTTKIKLISTLTQHIGCCCKCCLTSLVFEFKLTISKRKCTVCMRLSGKEELDMTGIPWNLFVIPLKYDYSHSLADFFLPSVLVNPQITYYMFMQKHTHVFYIVVKPVTDINREKQMLINCCIKCMKSFLL